MVKSPEINRKGKSTLNFVIPPALMAIYSESNETLFKQYIVEKNTAIGRDKGINVRDMLPSSPTTNLIEISLETKS